MSRIRDLRCVAQFPLRLDSPTHHSSPYSKSIMLAAIYYKMQLSECVRVCVCLWERVPSASASTYALANSKYASNTINLYFYTVVMLCVCWCPFHYSFLFFIIYSTYNHFDIVSPSLLPPPSLFHFHLHFHFVSIWPSRLVQSSRRVFHYLLVFAVITTLDAFCWCYSLTTT